MALRGYGRCGPLLARYYSPGGILRFASVDPGADVSMAFPGSWNKYAYVRNNPILFSDPTGRAIYNKAVDPATRVSANLLTKSLTIQMHFGGSGPNLIIRNINRPVPHPAGGRTDARITVTRDSQGNIIAATIDIYAAGGRDSNRTYANMKHELGHAANEADGICPTHPPSKDPNAPDERRATDRGNIIEQEALAAQAQEASNQCCSPFPELEKTASQEHFEQGEREAEAARRSSQSQPGYRSAELPTTVRVGGR